MAEVSAAEGMKKEEIELDLGLSIGGSFRKPEKSKLDEVPREKDTKTSSLSPPVVSSEPESSLPNTQTKREMQALRRQEAKRKREEKRSRGCGGRNEALTEEQSPAAKKERLEANVNLNLSNAESEPPTPVQPEPGQYPYPPPVQFVPCTNGFAFACHVMPCWAPAGGVSGFRPFQAHKDLGSNGCETEQKTASINGGLGKTASLSGSPRCSSSTVSDHQSAASLEGGGSSETRSHSSHSHLNGSVSKETTNAINSDHKATANSFESHSRIDDPKMPPKEEPKSETIEPVSFPKPISANRNSSSTPTSPPPLKEVTKMEPPPVTVAKPPKPRTQTSSLPQMPYVSTTGNGPNGKTIHGFLYRYTKKSEISIVCVCHGSTFSPAEFVQHAGGTDVSQPLRHITVIPSAFG